MTQQGHGSISVSLIILMLVTGIIILALVGMDSKSPLGYAGRALILVSITWGVLKLLGQVISPRTCSSARGRDRGVTP